MKKVTMFTGIVRNFTPKKGETAKLDINDLPPMVVEAIGGEAPRPINLVSGTVAKGQGLEPGKNYIFKAVHSGLVESTVNEGEMIEGFNISSVGEVDVEKAIDWYERKGLKFQIEPEVDNERVTNKGEASQQKIPGEVTPRRESNVKENQPAEEV